MKINKQSLQARASFIAKEKGVLPNVKLDPVIRTVYKKALG